MGSFRMLRRVARADDSDWSAGVGVPTVDQTVKVGLGSSAPLSPNGGLKFFCVWTDANGVPNLVEATAFDIRVFEIVVASNGSRMAIAGDSEDNVPPREARIFQGLTSGEIAIRVTGTAAATATHFEVWVGDF